MTTDDSARMLRTTTIRVKGVQLTVADQGAFFGAQSRHSMLLLFVCKVVDIQYRRLARLMHQSRHMILLIFAGLRLLMIFTALHRLPMFTGLRRPTGHNMQQLSGSICLYVDLCVCVYVCARVCVREQESEKITSSLCSS